MGDRKTPEHRAAIGEAMRRNWAERKARAEISERIMNMVGAGDLEGASRLYWNRIAAPMNRTRLEAYQAYVDSGIPQAVARPLYDSGAELAAELAEDLAEIALEEARGPARRAFRNKLRTMEPGLTDHQIAARFSAAFQESLSDDEVARRFSRAIVNQLREMKQMKDLHPNRSAAEQQEIYGSIPTIQSRAAMRNQAANQLQGQRIEDAASAVAVQPHQTEHSVTTGEHEHLYPDDETRQVFSIRRHSHNNDALHDPHPSRPSHAQRQGKDQS